MLRWCFSYLNTIVAGVHPWMIDMQKTYFTFDSWWNTPVVISTCCMAKQGWIPERTSSSFFVIQGPFKSTNTPFFLPTFLRTFAFWSQDLTSGFGSCLPQKTFLRWGGMFWQLRNYWSKSLSYWTLWSNNKAPMLTTTPTSILRLHSTVIQASTSGFRIGI